MQMPYSPFITILTASLNNGSKIRETLLSVKNQKYQDLEHLVIDGGSHDNTTDILKEFVGSYNLTWISEPDRGIADALNKGLRGGKGRYVLVLHADDRLLTSDTLENIYPLLKTERYDIVSLPVIFNHLYKREIMLTPIPVLWWHRFRNIFPHQGVFTHRRVMEKIGNFDIRYQISMDYDFFYRALLAGCSFRFDKTPIAHMGGFGLSSRKDMLKLRLSEEFKIQKQNETKICWRLLQLAFRTLYPPFKIQLCSSIGS